jgi:hypothetical protein
MNTPKVLQRDPAAGYLYRQCPDMSRGRTCKVKVQVLELEGSSVKTCAWPTNPALTSACSRRVSLVSKHQLPMYSMYLYVLLPVLSSHANFLGSMTDVALEDNVESRAARTPVPKQGHQQTMSHRHVHFTISKQSPIILGPPQI